jgi:hypothetical protein
MKITQDTLYDPTGAGASANGSNGQALTAEEDMTQISERFQQMGGEIYVCVDPLLKLAPHTQIELPVLADFCFV